MNYLKIYYLIIENAKEKSEERLRLKKDKDAYFETHHIIPKSSGGSNSNENLALLTVREHFICHWLLYKINPTKENAFSWWMMSNNNGNKHHKDRWVQTSRKYEYARKAFSDHIGEIHRHKKLSEEHRKKISIANSGDKNYMYGRTHSDEHKQYLSTINSGDKNAFYGMTHSEESRIKISNAKKKLVGDKHPHYGKTDLHSEETKQKFSEMYKGKPRNKPHEIVKCPHCNKEGIKPNIKRWHFDNCKRKNDNEFSAVL